MLPVLPSWWGEEHPHPKNPTTLKPSSFDLRFFGPRSFEPRHFMDPHNAVDGSAPMYVRRYGTRKRGHLLSATAFANLQCLNAARAKFPTRDSSREFFHLTASAYIGHAGKHLRSGAATRAQAALIMNRRTRRLRDNGSKEAQATTKEDALAKWTTLTQG